MRHLIPGFLLSCLLLLPTQADEHDLKAPPEPKGMKSLFNGKDLTGWDGDARLWSVKEGAIRGETTPENVAQGNTFLISEHGDFSNFELRMTFRCNEVNNSGVQYRSHRVTEGVRNDWVVRGYQYEIRNENELPNVSGFIYDERGTRRRICLVGERASWEADGKKLIADDLIDADGFRKLFKLDDWNDIIVIAKDNHIRHYLNGRLILEFTDNHPELAIPSGLIALQLHAGKPMWCEFKNIRIKTLE